MVCATNMCLTWVDETIVHAYHACIRNTPKKEKKKKKKRNMCTTRDTETDHNKNQEPSKMTDLCERRVWGLKDTYLALNGQ
jgi:hypothetical protein